MIELSASDPGPSFGALSFVALEAGVQVAEDAFRAGHYRQALDGYSNLLQARIVGATGANGPAAADLIVIERVVELAILFGLHSAADDLLDGMVALTLATANDLAADYAQMKRVELALSRGAVRDAFERLKELSRRIGDPDTIDFSPQGLAAWESRIAWRHYPMGGWLLLLTRAYFTFGRILASLGQYRESIHAIDRALVLLRNESAPDLACRTRPHLLLVRGIALLEQGEMAGVQAVVDILAAEADDALTPMIRTRRIELSARLDMMQGRLGRAIETFEQVVAICQASGFEGAGARAALNLVHVLVLLNRVRDALALVDTVDSYARRIGDETLVMRASAARLVAFARRRSPAEAVSVALSVRGMMLARRQRPDVLNCDPLPVLPTIPQSDNYLEFFENRALEFQWLLGLDDVEEAERRLAVIRDVFSSTDSLLVRGRLEVLEGLLEFVRNEFAGADLRFATAEAALSSMSLRPELWQLAQLRGRCGERLGRVAETRQHSEQAERLLAELAGTLAATDRPIYLLNKATVEEEFIATQVDALLHAQIAVASAPVIARWRQRLRVMRRLDLLMDQLDGYKAALAGRELSGGGTLGFGSPPRRGGFYRLIRRLTGISRDRALVSYVVLPDRVVTIWSAFLTLGFAVSPITRLDLRERVRAWHETMQSGGPARDARDLGRAKDAASGARQANSGAGIMADLARALQLDSVVAALPKRVTSLRIVPDDVLHGLPFSALPFREHYLVERFAVSTGFDTMPDRSPRAATSGTGMVVAVGTGTGNIPPLPKAAEEARAVGAWMSRRKLPLHSLVDAAATHDAVMDGLRKAALMHVACHGTYQPDRPDASGLVLVPGPGRAEVLTLRQLSSLYLPNMRHVTLSSCWSADNFVLPGRHIISLPQTLSRIGVESTLGSLWPVDDDVAGAFMERFYKSLDRMPRDAALREAQLACLAGALDCRREGVADIVDTKAPFYWAGFSLYGNPGLLRP